MANEALKILAIDDNQDNLISLKAVLRDLIPNVSVLTAQNGYKGIELAQMEDPDVILLDIVMPGIDGLEVCRRLKQDNRLKLIPVIFLTAQKTDRNGRLRALDAGGEAFLSKPLEEIELIAQVRSMAKIKAMNLMLHQEKEDLATLVARRTIELEHELAERHRAEQALRYANKELEKSQSAMLKMLEDLKSEVEFRTESEERLDLTLRSANMGVWSLELLEETREFDTQTCHLLGIEPASFHGTKEEFYQVVHPDDQDSLKATLARTLEQDVLYEPEFRVIWPDGSIHHITARARMHRNQAGQPVRLNGVIWDITERIIAQQALIQVNSKLEQRVRERTAELRTANAALQRASRLKDEFLANMSHELRTPLTGILGLAEILQGKIYGDINQKQFEALANIRESGEHLLSLINDILDLSKVEAGKVELHFVPVNIDNLLKACLRMVRQAAQKNRLSISTRLDPSVDIVMADERQLKQILVNLLSNAVKFTPEGGTIGVELTGDPEHQVMHIVVWDTGIGISEENQALLFKPFVQLDGSLSRQHEGTGLGLALVYRLVELHRGSIELQSQPGKGSRFSITLPWQKVDLPFPDSFPPMVLNSEEKADKQPEPLDQIQPPSDRSVWQVMVAEDNSITLQMLSDFVKSIGYRVVPVRSGAEVFESLQENPFDLLLLDIQMPLMNGIQVIQQLRSWPQTSSIPVIALTAQAMPGDRQRCLEAGANEYLSKPVNLEILRTVLQKYLKI